MLKKIKIFSVLIVLLCFSLSVSAQPKKVSADVEALLGYYQTEGGNIIIRERGGRLELLYGVTEKDYAFDQSNVYPLEKIRYNNYTLIIGNPREYRMGLDAKFERDKQGRGVTLIIDGKRYTRVFFLGENNNDFTVKAAKTLDELKQEALAAPMPVQDSNLLTAQLVNILSLDATIKVDMLYAKDKNFLNMKMYEEEKAFVDVEMGKALVQVQKKLADFGYGLVVWDAYRPWYVTKMFHDALPLEEKTLLESPDKGSSHNRGLSVDVSLYDLNTGEPVMMISDFDELSFRTFAKYQGGSELARWQRDLLRLFMENEGFTGVDHEWWHFDYKNFEQYRLLNTAFSEIK